MLPTKENLLQLVEAILNLDRPASSLFKEINALADGLSRIGSFERHPGDDLSKGETRTSDGLALSPQAAALCARDFVRTVQFMRGTYQAVCEQCVAKIEQPLKLLYVGCGPYALLVLPLMLCMRPQQVQISLVDIHADSMESVLRILHHLELHQYIAEYTIVDAATYQIDSARMPDIVLLEVMQSSLEKEPQIALSRHLLRQAPNAVLIPEEIRVSLCLLNPAKEFSPPGAEHEASHLARQRLELGCILCVNRETILGWELNASTYLPAARLQVPLEIPSGYEPMLLTEIQIYRDCYLHTYDSGLTYPRRLNTVFSATDILSFKYELGAHPKLVVTVESDR